LQQQQKSGQILHGRLKGELAVDHLAVEVDERHLIAPQLLERGAGGGDRHRPRII